MRISLDMVVVVIIFTLWLTYSAKGKELVNKLAWRWLQLIWGKRVYRFVDFGEYRMWYTTFRDGSKLIIKEDQFGNILNEETTGRDAEVYNKIRCNLLAAKC